MNNDSKINKDKWLQNLVEQVSWEKFHKPFKHKAYFNHRLRTTGGFYLLESHNIEINPKILEFYDENELLGVVIHELCHYHLHLTGLGYQHKDRDFKELLHQTGGSRYVKPLAQPKYHYQCQQCQTDYYRFRKMNLQKFVCGKCHGKLYLVEKIGDNND